MSGLWHGASWNFVVWGGLHGLYQVIGDALAKPKKKALRRLQVKTDCMSWKLLQTAVTFALVVFAWIFFRASCVAEALDICRRIVMKPTPWLLFNGGIFELGLNRPEMNILTVAIGILILVDLIRYNRKQMLDEFLFQQNLWFEWAVVILLILMIFVFGEYGANYYFQMFIYFQF